MIYCLVAMFLVTCELQVQGLLVMLSVAASPHFNLVSFLLSRLSSSHIFPLYILQLQPLYNPRRVEFACSLINRRCNESGRLDFDIDSLVVFKIHSRSCCTTFCSNIRFTCQAEEESRPLTKPRSRVTPPQLHWGSSSPHSLQ